MVTSRQDGLTARGRVRFFYGWVLGVLVDRMGPRRVMAWSTGAWCLILLLSSRIRSLWHMYTLFGLLGGVATGGLAYVPTNALLSRWFVRYRGLATGFSQTGSPLGIVMFGSLTQLAITALGWRNTYLAFGLLAGVTSLPLILLLVSDDPREMGLDPDGIPATASAPGRSGPRVPGMEVSSGRRLPPGYWIVFCTNVLRGVVVNALLVHQVAYLVDVGFTKMAAASYFALSSLLAILGGCAAGAIADPDPAACEAARPLVREAAAHADLDALLRSSDVSCAVVASPHATHAPHSGHHPDVSRWHVGTLKRSNLQAC